MSLTKGRAGGIAGTGVVMSDYSEQGAVPVDDAAVDDPPTVDEVAEQQRREHPEQARTARRPMPMHAPVEGDDGGG